MRKREEKEIVEDCKFFIQVLPKIFYFTLKSSLFKLGNLVGSGHFDESSATGFVGSDQHGNWSTFF